MKDITVYVLPGATRGEAKAFAESHPECSVLDVWIDTTYRGWWTYENRPAGTIYCPPKRQRGKIVARGMMPRLPSHTQTAAFVRIRVSAVALRTLDEIAASAWPGSRRLDRGGLWPGRHYAATTMTPLRVPDATVLAVQPASDRPSIVKQMGRKERRMNKLAILRRKRHEQQDSRNEE